MVGSSIIQSKNCVDGPKYFVQNDLPFLSRVYSIFNSLLAFCLVKPSVILDCYCDTGLGKMYEELKKLLSELPKNDNKRDNLAERLDKLEAKVEEVYNAPNMPGFVRAQQSFDGQTQH